MRTQCQRSVMLHQKASSTTSFEDSGVRAGLANLHRNVANMGLFPSQRRIRIAVELDYKLVHPNEFTQP